MSTLYQERAADIERETKRLIQLGVSSSQAEQSATFTVGQEARRTAAAIRRGVRWPGHERMP